MEPSVVLQMQITSSGQISVRIHSSSEKEEKAGLDLYDRIKPAIRVAQALLQQP